MADGGKSELRPHTVPFSCLLPGTHKHMSEKTPALCPELWERKETPPKASGPQGHGPSDLGPKPGVTLCCAILEFLVITGKRPQLFILLLK